MAHTIPVPAFLDSIHPWQQEVLQAFDRRLARFFLLCWHRRARKTTLGLNLLIREAIAHPGRVYGYIGPTYKQAKAIIWRDPMMLSRYLPEPLIAQKNESELLIKFTNGSLLAIKGADDPDSLRGLDFAGIVLDEWALMKVSVWTEILRPIITQSPERWGVFAFTPKGRNFVYDTWRQADAWPQEWYKSLLTVSRSQLMPAVELEKAQREMPRALYDQEFECSFLADEEQTLIPAKSVEALAGVKRHWQELRRVVTCDPSQGGDECVLYCLENTAVKDTKILHVRDTMVIAGEIAAMMYKHRVSLAAVDAIGVGAGIVDRLREQGKEVLAINSAEKATDDGRFVNRRAEMWWTAMEAIQRQEVMYPSDEELRRELSFVQYKVVDSSGRIQLEPKHDTRERLGRSPDRADAFVYGLWALRQARPMRQQDAWAVSREPAEVTTGIMSAMVA